MTSNFVKEKANQILLDFNITTPPVPIEEIIEGFALKIEMVDKNEKYEGELIPELRIIRCNSRKPVHRQRFTLAHELGHMVLSHKERLFEDIEESFNEIEEQFSYADNTSYGKPREIEANQFAREILMPTAWVQKDWKKYKKDVSGMADYYCVSKDALFIKLLDAGLLDY
jgi:Zn-dependent peptidase ImmA (M78 family)